MRVAVNGFGSIWTRRFGKNPDSRTRFTRDAAFYNTTGVPVDGRIRARSRVYGVVRFNGGSGFTPHQPGQMLNCVFDCIAPDTWNNGNRVLFARLITSPAQPDCYLVTIRDNVTGWIDRDSTWKAPDCFLVSFSESDVRQEAMLLMPAFKWVRGANGVFVLNPDTRQPLTARLMCDGR